MSRILREQFWDRSPVLVARELLGKYLVRRLAGKVFRFRIVETEAYGGLEDKASHASRGQTPRNKVMWSRPGTIYVYFTYGMHYMLNIVCRPIGSPAAVLIRGVEDCIGPGRLTKKLGIDKSLNGLILGRKAGLWIESDLKVEKFKIKKLPRVGIGYAGPIWSKKLWRFVLV